MLLALPFPAIDPVLIDIGPFAIRWYALAYIAAKNRISVLFTLKIKKLGTRHGHNA